MKRITEIKQGDLVRLYACGWQRVLADPVYNQEDGRVYTVFQILGLRLPQLLVFDHREEFEVERRMDTK